MNLMDKLTKGMISYKPMKAISSDASIEEKLLDEIKKQKLINKDPHAIETSAERKDNTTGTILQKAKYKVSWFDRGKGRMSPKLGVVPIIEAKMCSFSEYEAFLLDFEASLKDRNHPETKEFLKEFEKKVQEHKLNQTRGRRLAAAEKHFAENNEELEFKKSHMTSKEYENQIEYFKNDREYSLKEIEKDYHEDLARLNQRN